MGHQTELYPVNVKVLATLMAHKVLVETSTYRKKTFTGLLTYFFSFTSFSYKVGLIRTLVDRAYKINNSLLSFNNDIKKLTHIFKRNQYPEYLINRVVKAYKLLYLPLSNFAQRTVRTLVKRILQ